jgi:hypothetical protein
MKLQRPRAIDAFKADTGAMVDQFLTRKSTLPNCLTTLADALTKVKPKLRPSEFPYLTDIAIANNARVMREADRRERDRIGACERRRKSKLSNRT